MAIIDSLKKISDTVWELPVTYKEGMRVPARIIATEKLAREMETYSNWFPTTRLPGCQTEQKLTAVLALDFPARSSHEGYRATHPKLARKLNPLAWPIIKT